MRTQDTSYRVKERALGAWDREIKGKSDGKVMGMLQRERMPQTFKIFKDSIECKGVRVGIEFNMHPLVKLI